MNRFSDLYWQSQDDLRLHARDYAPTTPSRQLPVICLHGLTRNARDFEDVAPRIAAKGRRVLVAEFRGRGLSAYAPDPMTYWPTVYAQDIAALMDAAGIDRALFVGTSLGGLVTMIFASLRPERVAGAVLNDVGPQLSPVGLARIAGYLGFSSTVDDWAGAADLAKALNGVAFPYYTAADWDAFARRLFVQDEAGTLRLDYDPDISVPFKQAGSSNASPDLTPLFVNLNRDRPVLLVRGAISDLIDAPLVGVMRHHAPQMAYVEVTNVGHAPMLTEPEAWTALATWLDAAP